MLALRDLLTITLWRRNVDEFYMYNELQALIRDNLYLFNVLRTAMRDVGYDPYNTADDGVMALRS